jgi:hypothetical protein
VTFARTILGNINGTASGFTGSLGGDVTGTQGNTTVAKINGSPLGPLSGASNGQVLKFNGTNWAPGTDNSGLSSVSTGAGLTGDGTSGNPLSVDYSTVQRHYVRTMVVSPDPSSATNSGTNLLNAVNGITDASATNPYLVHVEPGVYDLGTGTLSMQPYVDIEGSGQDVTTITSSGTDATTVVGTDNAEIRDVTVRATASYQAQAIQINSGSPHFTDITAIASGGSYANEAVAAFGGSPVLRGVTARGLGNGSTGLYVLGAAAVTVDTSVVSGDELAGTAQFGATINIANSRINKPFFVFQGTVTCVYDYSNSYAPLNSSCS